MTFMGHFPWLCWTYLGCCAVGFLLTCSFYLSSQPPWWQQNYPQPPVSQQPGGLRPIFSGKKRSPFFFWRHVPGVPCFPDPTCFLENLNSYRRILQCMPVYLAERIPGSRGYITSRGLSKRSKTNTNGRNAGSKAWKHLTTYWWLKCLHCFCLGPYTFCLVMLTLYLLVKSNTHLWRLKSAHFWRHLLFLSDFVGQIRVFHGHVRSCATNSNIFAYLCLGGAWCYSFVPLEEQGWGGYNLERRQNGLTCQYRRWDAPLDEEVFCCFFSGHVSRLRE